MTTSTPDPAWAEMRERVECAALLYRLHMESLFLTAQISKTHRSSPAYACLREEANANHARFNQQWTVWTERWPRQTWTNFIAGKGEGAPLKR